MNKTIFILGLLSLLLLVLLFLGESHWQDDKEEFTRLRDELSGAYLHATDLVLSQGASTFHFQKNSSYGESSQGENILLAKQGLWQEVQLGRGLQEKLRLDILRWFEQASWYRLGRVKDVNINTFGLGEKESLKVEVGSGEKRDICHIGSKVPEREARYLYCEGSAWYGYAGAAWVEALFADKHAWMEPRIFRIASDEVQSMLFSSLQGSVVFIERDAQGWKVQGKEADLRFLETFIQGVLELEAENLPLEIEIPLTAPAFQTIVIQTQEKETVQAKVYLLSGESDVAGLRITGDERSVYPISLLKLRSLLPSPEGLQGEDKLHD